MSFEFGDSPVPFIWFQLRLRVWDEGGRDPVGECPLPCFSGSLVVDRHCGCAVSGCGHEFADGGTVLCEKSESGASQVVEAEVFASDGFTGTTEVEAQGAGGHWFGVVA